MPRLMFALACAITTACLAPGLAVLVSASDAARAVAIPPGLDQYMPLPADNPLTIQKIERGRELFHDRRLSRDGSRACASCHDPARAFAGTDARSIGVFGRVGPRNVPAILNRGYGERFFWDGRISTLEEQVLQPIVNPVEMDLTLEEAEARVGLDADEISRLLASYVRSILSGDAPFDRFLLGDTAAMTEQQQQGLEVFRNKGNCVACHVGPNLTDESLHNTGVAYLNGEPTDLGMGDGAFKTPTLREVARTAPYMHDGSLATLEEVVDFYSQGGRENPNLDREIAPRNFTESEGTSLVQFLGSLSGTVLEAGRTMEIGKRQAER